VCGIEWSGEKKWDSEKKWERKVGQNPGPHDRLSRPLFIIQTRFIPFEDEGVESEWENLSNSNSVCLLSAVFHLSYESERELASDPFLGFNEYRVIFDPFKVDSFLDSYRKEPRTSQNQPLQWKQHLNGDVGQTILESWRKYQRNMKEIRKRAEKLRNKSA
jgi:hypothetical protein